MSFVIQSVLTLVDGQLIVFSRDLSNRRSTDIRDIESLAPMADGIALKPKGADYQTLYELGMAGDLVEVKRVPIDKSEVAKAKLPHSGSPRQNVRPQLIDSLDQDPQRWFDTTVMVTPWLAHLASDKRTIEVYARTSPAQATMPWSLIIERLVV